MEFVAMAEAEPSPVHQYKEVTFRTPVILGSDALPVTYESQLIRYRRGELLHQDVIPAACMSLPNGMVIDLPLTDNTAYFEKMLAWLPL